MSMLFVSEDLCLQVLGSITLGFLGSQLSQVLCVHALREQGSLPPGSWEHNIILLIHQLTPAQILYISGIFLQSLITQKKKSNKQSHHVLISLDFHIFPD